MGDDPVLDVEGARDAGMRVIQIVPGGRATGPVKPDAVIATLGELPAALDRPRARCARIAVMRLARLASAGGRNYLIAAAVVVLVFALFVWAPDFLATMETKLYDLHFVLRGARTAGDQVVIVAADEKSLAALGRWPWPRSVLADLVTALSGRRGQGDRVRYPAERAAGGGRAARADRALGALHGARARARRRRPGAPPRARRATRAGRSRRPARGGDSHRAAAWSCRRCSRSTAFATAPPEPSGAPLKSALVSFAPLRRARRLSAAPRAAAGVPIPRLAEAAKDLGHVNMVADSDGTTRWEALVFEYRGYYYPSLAVEAHPAGDGGARRRR